MERRLFGLFREAAGEAALIELRMRMLTEKVPALRKYAHDQQLANIETQIVNWFGTRLSEEDARRFEQCRQARNKLLHCDFSVAKEKLHEMGVQARSGKVISMQLSEGSLLAQVGAALQGTSESAVMVSELRVTKGASIYAWLIELGGAGYFQEAVRVFGEAGAVLNGLFVVCDELVQQSK